MIGLFEDKTIFESRRGTSLYYIDHGPKSLSCWQCKSDNRTSGEAQIHVIPFSAVSEDQLRVIGIWDEIDEETQKTIKIIDKVGEKQFAKDNDLAAPPEPKKKRQSLDKFKGYPEYLECKCGEKTKANYSYLAKKALAAKIDVMELVNNYECQICNPTKGRGRKRNPVFDGLPEFLECKCGKTVRANYSQLSKKAERQGATLRKVIDEYTCQTCNPTKGRPKKRKSI